MTTDGGQAIEIDLAVDWRENDPVGMPIGRVLSLRDAVASKMGALYSRGEARDYVDVDAIRASGRFTDAQLLDEAADRDAGFDPRIFADQLEQVRRIDFARVERYGIDRDGWARMTRRLLDWAGEIRASDG